MALSVVYATVNGVLVEEDRGGVVTCFVSDTLGSVIQTRDAAGNLTSSTTYWPFGEVRTSSGTNPSPWRFVGTLGYYKDTAVRLYVRARMLRADLSRWLSVDRYWPREFPYQYVNSNPITLADPKGLSPCSEDCDKSCDDFIAKNPSWCADPPSPPYPPGSKALAFAYCCNGKPYQCYCPGQKPSTNPYIKACVEVHEHGHINAGSCAAGYTGPPRKWNNECTALKAGIKWANEQCKRIISNDCIDLDDWRCAECRRLKYACTPMPDEKWLSQYCKGCKMQ